MIRKYRIILFLNVVTWGIVSGLVISRRKAVVASLPYLSIPILNPQTSDAAPPLSSADGDSWNARISRKFRISPVKLIRSPLNQDFAVLLMRSSYNAIDELDCVAMDQFQKDFFFIRSAEYLSYVNQLGPGLVKQGDLSDPYYFDFISFAQYATIFREISMDPAFIFEEQQPILVNEENQQFVTRVIQRKEAFFDNSKLPIYHDYLVGSKILDKINETFSSSKAAIPYLGTDATSNDLIFGLKQLIDIFLINGFAFGGSVTLMKSGPSDKASGCTVEIVMKSPANLWSRKALNQMKASPTNDFILKTAKVYLQRCGFEVVSATVQFPGYDEVITITVR